MKATYGTKQHAIDERQKIYFIAFALQSYLTRISCLVHSSYCEFYDNYHPRFQQSRLRLATMTNF
jgi:hypothetical protein